MQLSHRIVNTNGVRLVEMTHIPGGKCENLIPARTKIKTVEMCPNAMKLAERSIIACPISDLGAKFIQVL